MFSKVLLPISLFAAVVVAAPAAYPNDGATPSPTIIVLNSNVSCTSAVSPGDVNSSPSPSVILLNNPSPTHASSYDPDVGYATGKQDSGSPSIIALNAPAPSPTVIKLNRRQFSSSSTFSFGGIVPSSTGTSTTSSSQSFSFGGIVTPSSSSPAFTPTPSSVAANGASTFTSTGADGTVTVLLLSTATLTVTGDSCSSTPPVNPALATSSSSIIGGSSAFPFSVPSSSPSSPTSSSFGVDVQASPASSLAVINLNKPPASPTSPPAFSFSSPPTPTV